jgi:hypothetical protein
MLQSPRSKCGRRRGVPPHALQPFAPSVPSPFAELRTEWQANRASLSLSYEMGVGNLIANP